MPDQGSSSFRYSMEAVFRLGPGKSHLAAEHPPTRQDHDGAPRGASSRLRARSCRPAPDKQTPGGEPRRAPSTR